MRRSCRARQPPPTCSSPSPTKSERAVPAGGESFTVVRLEGNGVAGADYDLVIRGGLVVDGLGDPAFDGDVAITDGRITAVGAAPGGAARTIDATGRVVAPGFVDIHTHYDVQLFWDPSLEASPWHGVPT